jgi:hypothetical protein
MNPVEKMLQLLLHFLFNGKIHYFNYTRLMCCNYIYRARECYTCCRKIKPLLSAWVDNLGIIQLEFRLASARWRTSKGSSS